MSFIENRVPPPMVMILCALLMWFVARSYGGDTFGDWRYWLGGSMMAAGVACAVTGLLAFAKAKTTPNPIKISAVSALVTGSIYQFTRNPMYLGLVIVLLGFAVLLGHVWLVIGPALFGLFILRFQIMPEERVMREKFGADYDAYCARVRRWI